MVVLALAGGVLALALALLDPAGLRAPPVELRLARLSSERVDTLAISLAAALLAAALGSGLGTLLGLALRSRSRAPWLAGLGILGLLPLAAPPLVLVLAVAGSLDVQALFEGAPAAALEAPRAALALGLAHVPAAVAIATIVVSVAGARAEPAIIETARLLGAGRLRRLLSFELPAVAAASLLSLALSFWLVATSMAATLGLPWSDGAGS